MTAVLVWGELLWDRFPDGDRLGGAPANVAWHLAQLGTSVALVTRVGDDELGHAAIAQMAAIGVDTSLVQIDAERATGEVNVTVEHGEPRYRLQPGRAWERIELTPAVRERLVAARALVYGTLSQRTPEGLAAFGAALAAASPRVARVCDPNLRPSSPAPDAGRPQGVGPRAKRARGSAHDDAARARSARQARVNDDDNHALAQALAAADIVKVNEREVEMIRARLGHPYPVAHLLARGARLVAVTRGAEGSTWYAPPSVSSAPLEVPAIAAAPGGDNVGCGDAFVAGLVHGLLLGWPWPRIGRLAAAVAAEVAGARGATPVLTVRP